MTPLERALTYAERGWLIFPAHSISRGHCTCGKGPRCESPGKHPRTTNGVKDASLDPDTIRNWWTTWPDANIALGAGRQSGVFVVDIDQRKSGFESLEEFEEERGDTLPKTLTALSGGGGRHLFYRYPSAPVGNRNDWLRGVDIKSDGGYVILPDGAHISGGRYSWLNLDTEIVTAPADLIDSVRTSGLSGSGRTELPDTSDILSGVPEGKRDETLFRAACRWRRQLGDGARSAVEMLALQAAANCKPEFPREEALRKVEQAFRQDHSDGEWDWDFETDEGDPIHHLTDLGNAKRFVDRHVEQLRYVPQWGWMSWSEVGWVNVSEHNVEYMVRDVPDIIRDDAKKFSDPLQAQRVSKWAMTTESAGHLAAIEKLSRADPRIKRDVDEFDSDDHMLACRNGLVDLRTGELRPFSRDDLVTKNTNVIYDPSFTLPQWDRFLDQATEGDTALIKYLQLSAGYTLTGSNAEECFFIVSGPPASGKSTFLDGLHAAFGIYGTTTQSDTFMYKRGVQTPKDELARLAGIRMVSVSEIRQGESFNEALIKQLTGGDKVTARFLYRDTFEFRPKLKLWIGTNHDPDTRDEAMWRRIKKVSFDHVVPKEKRDPLLKEIIRDPEIGGRAVLAWAVRGAIEWHRLGHLAQPTSVTAAIMDYHSEQDRFGNFLAEVTDRQPGSVTPLRELYRAYSEWSKSVNELPLRTTQFTSELRRRGFPTVLSEQDRVRYVQDMDVKPMQITSTGVGWA